MYFYRPAKMPHIILPNVWDLCILIMVFATLSILVWGASEMSLPYQLGTKINITLDPQALPKYAINTIIRMFIALIISFGFTLSVGYLAAKNKYAERIIMPFIDIMQSLPILGMLSITVLSFIRLFPNSQLGPECAAIFAIFTSQVWNMTLSFYQSLKSVPEELHEAAKIFHLDAWAKFWRIEVPFAIPSLLWNTMVSLSAAWFFVVASEAIYVSNQLISLPGIGSYIHLAIEQASLPAMGWALLTMFLVILSYDQLVFRPLIKWAEKFKPSISDESFSPKSWFYDLLIKTRLIKYLSQNFHTLMNFIVHPPLNFHKIKKIAKLKKLPKVPSNLGLWFVIGVGGLTLISMSYVARFVYHEIPLSEIKLVFYLGAITGFKVVILVLISSLIWVPVGAIIGQSPRAAQICQPIAQFLAAFPVNLIYPFVVFVIVKYQLNVDIWTTPLMMLGTQWYILFNVIAGVSAIPEDILLAAKNLGLKGRVWWQRLILPAIFPYYVTGAMTAAGGCWNAAIVADYIKWGEHELIATGLGSYITMHSNAGNLPQIVLGIAVMGIYVMFLNHFVWQKLYKFAIERYSMGLSI